VYHHTLNEKFNQCYCSILLVSIGLLLVKHVMGQMFMESKYDGERL